MPAFSQGHGQFALSVGTGKSEGERLVFQCQNGHAALIHKGHIILACGLAGCVVVVIATSGHPHSCYGNACQQKYLVQFHCYDY